MTKALYSQGELDNTATSVANTTQYWICGAAGGNLSNHGTVEADRQIRQKNSGTFSDLTLSLSANGIAGATTFTFRKNIANGNMSITVPSSTTGNFTLSTPATTTDSVTANDKVCVRSVPGATTGTFTITTMSVSFLNTSGPDTVSRLVSGGTPNASVSTASTTYYEAIAGEMSSPLGTTEANTKCRMRKAGSLDNASVYARSNGRTTTTTYRIRKNGADSASSFTVAASATGWFEDTSNSVTVAAGDDVNWSITTGTGTGTQSIASLCCDYVTTDGWFPLVIATAGSTSTIAKAVTAYIALGGYLDGSNTTESRIDEQVSGSYTFAELTVLVSQNSIAASSSVTVMKNTVATALTAPITASTTGVFTDSTHTFTTTDTDKIDHKLVTGSSTGTVTLTINNIIFWGQEIVSGGTPIDSTVTGKSFANKFITHG